MKKTLLSLLALSGLAMADSPAWHAVNNGDGTGTWSTTISGGFNFDLGDLAIKDNESFTLTVYQTAESWGNGYGTAMIATGEPYDNCGGADTFRFYIGKTGTSNEQLLIQVNNWGYNNSGMTNYTNNATATPSAATPLTFGFSFTFVNSADAEGGDDYIEFASLPGSDITFDAKRDYNVVSTYNFSHLQNATTNTQAALPTNVVTTITITKQAPEPATATLSLLALAGLAARRRR